MEDRSIKVKREFHDLLARNKERGLLSRRLEQRMKRLGYDLSENPKPLNQKKQRRQKTGQMQVDRYLVFLQRQKGKPYKVKDWKPESVIEHTDDFFEWINSITFGNFPDKTHYLPFERYKAQAAYFMETARNPYDTNNVDERTEIILDEYSKIDQNTLYFSMKYAKVKEGSSEAGKIDYVPKEHNAVLFYIMDCGYSFIFGKPRQIFATTTVGIYIMKKLLCQSNFFMKFITEDIETGMEIFEDKLKVPYGFLPRWMNPRVARDYNRGFQLGRKVRKGEFAYPNSRIQVVAPSKTAINGGSPQCVFVDEVGNVPDLIPMVLEAMPTMYIDPNQDGNLVMVRQILCWGTGVSDNKGKNAFHSLWTSVIHNWEKKNFKSAIFVPLFFSWHTRCTTDIYEENRILYYSGALDSIQNYSTEEQKAIFHMHYPSSWTDMFALASNKLVSRDLIEKNLGRLRSKPACDKPIYGWFEPVYDESVKYNESVGVPYKIIGARFVPFDDNIENLGKVSAMMHREPEQSWTNRYFMGTDPIATETGQSMFASAIWDKEDCTVSCIVNFRKSQDHKAAFLQSLLMSIYYDVQNTDGRGVPELIENNIGTNYKDFKDLLGYGNNLVFNKELPQDLQGGGAFWGINSKQKRKEIIVSNLSECVTTYAENIFHDIVYKQLDTYVPNVTGTGTTWKPADPRLYRDDVLDAVAYAYICSKTCHEPPKNLGGQEVVRTTVEYQMVRMANGSLLRMLVEKTV